MNNNLDEKKLISRLKKHDQEAFDSIYKKYKQTAINGIKKQIKFSYDFEGVVDELVQDVFQRVWDNIERFDESKDFRPWLSTIANNIAIDYLRKEKNFLENINTKYEIEESSVASQLRTNLKITDFETDAKAVLNDFEYQVLILSLIYKYKRKDTSKILDKPIGTITRVYVEALAKMREYYNK